MIRKVHLALNAWAEFKLFADERNLSCEIGYKPFVSEGKLAKGELPGSGTRAKRSGRSIVPVSLICNPAMSFVDRLVQELPKDQQQVIVAKYLSSGRDGERVSRFCRLMNVKQRTFYHRLHKAHEFLKSRGVSGMY